MRYLIFLLALSPVAKGFASPTPLWNCSVQTVLRGDADFFLRYGRDSWKGTAAMLCRTNEKSQSKSVVINYNGADLGFGVNESSGLDLHIDIVTSTDPSDFQAYAYVYNKAVDPTIVWRTESGGLLIEATVSPDKTPGIQKSLQQGNLYIR